MQKTCVNSDPNIYKPDSPGFKPGSRVQVYGHYPVESGPVKY